MDLAIAGEPLVTSWRNWRKISGRPVALEGRDGRLLAYHAVGPHAPSARRSSRSCARPTIGGALVAHDGRGQPRRPADRDLRPRQRLVPPGGAGHWARWSSRQCFADRRPAVAARPRMRRSRPRRRGLCSRACPRASRRHRTPRGRARVLDEVLDGALRSETTLLQQARRLGTTS